MPLRHDATPIDHAATIGIAALKAGLHVLVEKPISVHKADCQRLIAAHRSKKQVFAAMFNQRTDSYYQKIRELGQLRDTLQDLVEHCQGDHRPDCPILKELASGSCCA